MYAPIHLTIHHSAIHSSINPFIYSQLLYEHASTQAPAKYIMHIYYI